MTSDGGLRAASLTATSLRMRGDTRELRQNFSEVWVYVEVSVPMYIG